MGNVHQTNVKPQRSRFAAFGAGLVVTTVLAGAALTARPLPTALPTGTDVARPDNPGSNVLEPKISTAKGAAETKPTRDASVERAVELWTPTGGGIAAVGSPKK